MSEATAGGRGMLEQRVSELERRERLALDERKAFAQRVDALEQNAEITVLSLDAGTALAALKDRVAVLEQGNSNGPDLAKRDRSAEARSRVIAAARRVCDPDANDVEFELRALSLAVNALYEVEIERAAESDPYARGYLRALMGTRKRLDVDIAPLLASAAKPEGEDE